MIGVVQAWGWCFLLVIIVIVIVIRCYYHYHHHIVISVISISNFHHYYYTSARFIWVVLGRLSLFTSSLLSLLSASNVQLLAV